MSTLEALVATETALAREASSFGELLGRLRNRFPAELVGDPEWEGLVESARVLPAELAAGLFGFELPLHERRPTADLGIAVVAGTKSASFFGQDAQARDGHRSVARVGPLLRKMGRQGSSLRRILEQSVLLEYDSGPGGRELRDPGIFLYAPQPTGGAGIRQLRDLRIGLDAIESAMLWERDNAERREAERVFRAMEPEWYVRSIGAFPARGRAVRLAVAGFRNPSSVALFFERVGRLDCQSTVFSTLARLNANNAYEDVAIHFDITARGLGPRLGVSPLAHGPAPVSTEVRGWRPLLESLEKDGLAVPQKLSALATGCSGVKVLLGRASPLVLRQGIHHIKLGLTGNALNEAKAYIFASMAPVQLFG